jgi:hypothetical protein
MERSKIVSGNTEEDIWQQISADFAMPDDISEYIRLLQLGDRSVFMSVEIDLGGGFEGGYQVTRFVSDLKRLDDFRFSLERQDFLSGIGKFFGMKDVVLGYPDFDQKIIVKTNKPDHLKSVLSDNKVKEAILSLSDFKFFIGHHHSSHTYVESGYLELRIDEGITDVDRLKSLYFLFTSVLERIEMESDSLLNYL